MKKRAVSGAVSVVVFLVTSATLNPQSAGAAEAQLVKGKVAVGLRAGVSTLTQDFDGGTKGEVGPVLSASVMYGLADWLLLGVDFELGKHQVEPDGGRHLGELRTLSVLPFAELRGCRGSFSPYASLGLGVNLNKFAEEPEGVSIQPENTVAFKIGTGVDFFLTEHLALNGEVGWKLNSGDFDAAAGGGGDFQASAFSTLLGVRYYF